MRLRPALPWLVAIVALVLVLMAAGARVHGRISTAAPIPAAPSAPTPPQP